MGVIALVGVASFAAVGKGQAKLVDDAQFDMTQGAVVNCDDDSAAFIANLPWYDAKYSTEPSSKLANACYYSFRCCTTRTEALQGACGSGDDVGMGDDCRSCLESNPPRSISRDCRLYYEKKIAISDKEEVSCKDGDGKVTVNSLNIDARCQHFLSGNYPYTLDDLKAGEVPKFDKKNKYFSNMFANLQTC